MKRLIGMFAFGVWDRRERTLTLVRDRLGIKPLYWAKFGGLFLFGSELKALRAHPGWRPRIDRAAVAAFCGTATSRRRTRFTRASQAEPGCILTLPWAGEPRIERYWDARAVARAGLADPFAPSDDELTEQLEGLLQGRRAPAHGRRRAARRLPVGRHRLLDRRGADAGRQCRAGADLYHRLRHAGYDEAQHAAAVARHLGTEHTELNVTPKQALDVIPRLPDIYDEPFADASQIPTFLVSAMTRRHVTVALSGDGGDELFGGYNRYQLASRRWRKPVAAAASVQTRHCRR